MIGKHNKYSRLNRPTPVYTTPPFDKAQKAQTDRRQSRIQELHEPTPLEISIKSFLW
jgi:hypothetical protein